MNRPPRIMVIGTILSKALPDVLYPGQLPADPRRPEFIRIQHAAELSRKFDELEADKRLPDIIIVAADNDLDGLDMLVTTQHNQGDDTLTSFVAANPPIPGLWIINWIQARFQEPPIIDYHPTFILFSKGEETRLYIDWVLEHTIVDLTCREKWTKLLKTIEVIDWIERGNPTRLMSIIQEVCNKPD